jgi:hypothetical protein
MTPQCKPSSIVRWCEIGLQLPSVRADSSWPINPTILISLLQERVSPCSTEGYVSRFHCLFPVCERLICSGVPWVSALIPITAPPFPRFDGLAVNAPGTRRGVPPPFTPQFFAQGVVHPRPRPVLPPRGEVVIDGAFRWKIMRQLIALTAGLQHVVDRVQHLTHVHGPWSSTLFRGRNERFQNYPLWVCQVTSVRFSLHPPSLIRYTPLSNGLLQLAGRLSVLVFVFIQVIQ